ncbi:MAG: response regulator transcription factor [Caldilinea sp.]
MSIIRTFLADDHAVLRDSLKVFLSLHPDIVLVGEAGDGLDTVREVLRIKPNVLVLDLSLPTLSGLEVTQRLRRDLSVCTGFRTGAALAARWRRLAQFDRTEDAQ